MTERTSPTDSESDDPHKSAADAFAHRVEIQHFDGLEELILFGSTARGDASSRSSDVDFLAVVTDDADRDAIEEALRDVAYDVMLEFGPVVEVYVFTRSEFDDRRAHPFLRRASREGTAYV
jgi:tRNA nucleotidyltransferase (CCA-adding enzyme)